MLVGGVVDSVDSLQARRPTASTDDDLRESCATAAEAAAGGSQSRLSGIVALPDIGIALAALADVPSDADAEVHCACVLRGLVHNCRFSADEVIHMLSDRLVITSTSNLSRRDPRDHDWDVCVVRSIENFIDANTTSGAARPTPVVFKPLWVIGGQRQQQQHRHRHLPHSLPQAHQHLFSDIREFVPVRLRQQVGLDGGQLLPVNMIKKMLPPASVGVRALCTTCDRMFNVNDGADRHDVFLGRMVA